MGASIGNQRPDYVENDAEITEENCHTAIPFWVRQAPPEDDPSKGRGRGLDLHFPADDDRDDPKPLCCTASGTGNWEDKDTAVFPPGYGSTCSKCLARINGRDYTSSTNGDTQPQKG